MIQVPSGWLVPATRQHHSIARPVSGFKCADAFLPTFQRLLADSQLSVEHQKCIVTVSDSGYQPGSDGLGIIAATFKASLAPRLALVFFPNISSSQLAEAFRL